MPRISTDNYDTVASWNGSQDLFIVEQPDGTKVATPAMVKQYVLGNSIDDIYSVMGQNGAKNLIPYPYYSESGYSNQGMTITYDADGVFTINKVAGTATAYYRIATLNFLKPSTKYRLVFEVENATSISIFLQKPTTGDYVTINNKSSGIFVAEFETTADSQISTRAIGLSCTASDTETNATVKVMIMLASDTDNTYEPYAMTNKQLTEEIGDLSQTGLTGDSVAEQLEKVNDDIVGLILSENSAGAIAVNDTYQIPTAMLSKKIIVLSINRAGTCGSIALPTFQITQGSCANGIKLVAGYGSNPTTDISAVLTISTTGLITLKYLSNWSPVYVVLRAI